VSNVNQEISLLKELSVGELDLQLEQAVRENDRSEQLICEYLVEMRDRRGHEQFGFVNIWDYAAERFGFSERKTRYLLGLGVKLKRLPKIREALASGKLGWSKASKVATVATTEDEAMWLDSALSLSVRALERKIHEDRDDIGVKLRVWLSRDQAAVWETAVEVCRRMAGENIDVGRCLELISGEFLATYAYLLAKEPEADTTQVSAKEASSEPVDPAGAEDHPFACPEGDELPSPLALSQSEFSRKVIERDGHQCTYPGCSIRWGLHAHHLEHRSRSGTRSKPKTNHPCNGTTVCFVHHRMTHSGVIGVTGTAPDNLTWRLPKLMEAAMKRAGAPPIEFELGPRPDEYEVAATNLA